MGTGANSPFPFLAPKILRLILHGFSQNLLQNPAPFAPSDDKLDDILLDLPPFHPSLFHPE